MNRVYTVTIGEETSRVVVFVSLPLPVKSLGQIYGDGPGHLIFYYVISRKFSNSQ